MSLNLTINTNIENEDLDKSKTDIIYNLFKNSYKNNSNFLILSWAALLLYNKITKNNNDLKYYKENLLKYYKYNKIFNKKIIKKFYIVFYKLIQKDIFIELTELIDIKKNNYNNSQQIIYDRITKKNYKDIKDYRKIFRYKNYIIKQYIILDFEDNYSIVSIINEIILQLYGYILLKFYDKKENFIIPKIYCIQSEIEEISNIITINITMEYINIKNKSDLDNNYQKKYYKTSRFLNFLNKNKLYHNDTHNDNLIFCNEKIILLDFGKASLYNAFNPSSSGFPKIFQIKKYKSKEQKKNIIKFIKIIMKKYTNNKIQKKKNLYIPYFFKIY